MLIIFLLKKMAFILILAAIIFLGYALYYGWQVVIIGAAFKAKVLCSAIFVSKRPPKDLLREDLKGIWRFIPTKIDFEKKSVTTFLPGIPHQRAVFHDGCGCTLLAGASEEKVRGQVAPINIDRPKLHPPVENTVTFSSPGKGLPPDVDGGQLAETIDKAFLEKDPNHPIRTRAVIIVYDGQIIAERYAAGISAQTALPGWSMTKSVINALIGILAKEGKLSIDQAALLPEWSGADDPRKNITMDHLLHMSSGLKFDERTGPVLSDLNRMLLRSPDAAAYTIAKPLKHAPGSHWYYASGTTNIICRIIRNTVGGRTIDYLNFPRNALFNKIGMDSAIIEADASGTLVGSSFMFATVRDWARFGQLYLQDGIWNNERILPEGWVAYTTTPASAAPRGRYGAHFWTNGGNVVTGNARPFPRLPADTFYAWGFEGQYTIIIPSRRLVVVRLGQTKKIKAWDMQAFVSDVLSAIKG
ncbi:MAG: serine hydrolase [Desulfobacterales bacterium]|nr:serine hydrolase [Desulfobacterales bacterium]